MKLMNELCIWLFHPKHSAIYSWLAKLQPPYSFDYDKDNEISTALSYIGLFMMYASKYFNIWLRNTIWFNGSKSYIYINSSKRENQPFNYALEALWENMELIW